VVAGDGDERTGGERSVGRSRGSATAAGKMVTRGGRKQQRKKAAAAEKVAEETAAASTAAQAAEETAAASTVEQAAGTVAKEEAYMARGVSVAEAATTELEVVVETTTEGSRTRGTPEEMVEAAVVRAARASGSEAKSLAVRRAVEIVIVESMQVGDVEAAREEITGAVQAMHGLGCSRSSDHGGGSGNG
jgi:hypothetical protein